MYRPPFHIKASPLKKGFPASEPSDHDAGCVTLLPIGVVRLQGSSINGTSIMFVGLPVSADSS